VLDRRSFDRPGACYFTGDRNRYIYSRDDPCRMAACASPHPHRNELRVDTAEELRTVDDDFVALYVEGCAEDFLFAGISDKYYPP
jgi:hypothetical protein